MLSLACAVCGAGNDPSQGSYVVMSIIISLLPLAMLGGIITWVVLRARKADALDQKTEDVGPSA
jgi:hypothetical protein